MRYISLNSRLIGRSGWLQTVSRGLRPLCLCPASFDATHTLQVLCLVCQLNAPDLSIPKTRLSTQKLQVRVPKPKTQDLELQNLRILKPSVPKARDTTPSGQSPTTLSSKLKLLRSRLLPKAGSTNHTCGRELRFARPGLEDIKFRIWSRV